MRKIEAAKADGARDVASRPGPSNEGALDDDLAGSGQTW